MVEAPPKMLGFAMDALQRYLVDIGLPGPDKGKGGKYLFLPPGYTGEVPEGYFVAKSPTYTVGFGVRGFKVDGKTDQAVALMKQIKVYPLAQKASPPAMEFLNGSGKPINTIHPDTFAFFEMLAQIVEEEPAEIFSPLERFQMQAIGIEKGKPFNPDAKTRAMLGEAARTGSAFARANSYASPIRDTYFYEDRKWQYVGDVPYDFVKDGILQVDRRAYVYYMALGNSPAMMAKNVGVGSYYLWAMVFTYGPVLAVIFLVGLGGVLSVTAAGRRGRGPALARLGPGAALGSRPLGAARHDDAALGHRRGPACHPDRAGRLRLPLPDPGHPVRLPGGWRSRSRRAAPPRPA